MADLKTDYKDDVLDSAVNEKRKWTVTENGDGTVTITDATTYLQRGDMFGAAELNEITLAVNECFQSVSNGKALIASAIADKKVATDATATFAQMAENISKIVLGSGNATVADVLSGKTFTNDDGVEYAGTMTNNGAVSKSITPSTSSQSYTIPKGYHDGAGKVTVAAAPTSLINGDATAANVLYGKTFFSDSYTAKTGSMTNNGAVSKSITPSTSAQSYTVPAGYHNGSGKVSVAAIPSTYKEAKTSTFTVTVSKSTAGTSADPQSYSLSFGKTFASTPTVVVQTVSNQNAYVVSVSSITTTGCTVKLRSKISNADQEGSFRWIAIV